MCCKRLDSRMTRKKILLIERWIWIANMNLAYWRTPLLYIVYARFFQLCLPTPVDLLVMSVCGVSEIISALCLLKGKYDHCVHTMLFVVEWAGEMEFNSFDDDNLFDSLLNDVGGFGWFQKRTLLLSLLASFVSACNHLSPIFLVFSPKTKCRHGQVRTLHFLYALS